MDDMAALERDIETQSHVVFDMETVPLIPGVVVARTDKPVDTQFSGNDMVWIAPWGLVAERLPAMLKGKCLVGQRLKYDLAVCYHNGVDLTACQWRDTELLGRLADENGLHSLDVLVKKHLGFSITKKNFWEIYSVYTDAPEDVRNEYAADDIFWTGKLYEFLTR